MVLIVEDDDALQALLVTILTDEGHRAHAVADGVQALHAIARQSPAVIVLDALMPVMDGEEFARIYHALPPPHAPIVLLTAAAPPIAAELGARVGAAAVIRKPFEVDDVMATVERFTSGSVVPT